MTDLMSRPLLRVEPSSPVPRRPVALAAALGACAAAVVGLIVCFACAVTAWFAAGTGSFGGGIRAGSLAWLLANGASLHTPAATITVIPLGASMAVGWLLYRAGYWAGGHSAVTSLRAVARGSGVMAAVYCVAAMTVAAVSRGDQVHAGLVRTVLATLSLGAVFGGAGMLRGSGTFPAFMSRIPIKARAVLAGAASGLAVMLLAGALLLSASLVVHFPTAVNLAEGLHAGRVGGALLAVVGVALVPNAVLCAGAFAAGPGFALGTGTAVAPGGVTLGALPAFPLLAAVPRDPSAMWLLQGLVVVPVIAGVVAGLVAVKRTPATRFDRAGLLGAFAGLLAGALFGAMTWLATGAVGPGRMQHIGPDVVATMGICVVAGTLGGAVAAAGVTWVHGALTRRRSRSVANKAEPEASEPESSEPASTPGP
jgi:hypothetical protein